MKSFNLIAVSTLLLAAAKADSWDRCVCTSGNKYDFCATSKGCGNLEHNYRTISYSSRWCVATLSKGKYYDIDGDEFHSTCVSLNRGGSCCTRDGKHESSSDGCAHIDMAGLDSTTESAPNQAGDEDHSSPAAPPANEARSLVKRADDPITLGCLSGHGTTYNMGGSYVIDAALASGVFTLHNRVPGPHGFAGVQFYNARGIAVGVAYRITVWLALAVADLPEGAASFRIFYA